MANLAIRGHRTRGKEVIQILEMLGGRTMYMYNGDDDTAIYFVDGLYIMADDVEDIKSIGFTVFTLEEFLEKYPYKVGDFVHIPEYESEVCICKISWNSLYNYMEYMVYRDDKPEWYTAKALLVYNTDTLIDKETNMNENNNQETLETKVFGYSVNDVIFTNDTGWIRITNKFWDCYTKEHVYEGIGIINEHEYKDIRHHNVTGKIPLEQSNQCKDVDDVRHVNSIIDDIMINQITNKVSVIKFNPDVCDNEIELQLGNYKIEDRDGKTYAVKNKPKYPKTYEECCKILNIRVNGNIAYTGNWVYGGEYLEKHLDVIRSFQKLKLCRDAYWKIAGEQLGLGKPWEPNWKDSNFKYCLKKMGDNIEKTSEMTISCILAFPTEEMRDAFYENFKDLIDSCKELL